MRDGGDEEQTKVVSFRLFVFCLSASLGSLRFLSIEERNNTLPIDCCLLIVLFLFID